MQKNNNEMKTEREKLLSIYLTKSLPYLNSAFLVNPKFLSKLIKHSKVKSHLRMNVDMTTAVILGH